MDIGDILGIFIVAPWLGLLPAGALGGLFIRTRQPLSAAAAGLWLLYVAYEYAMKWRIWCSGECNIRVDLLLIYPLLLAVSVAALVAVLKNRR